MLEYSCIDLFVPPKLKLSSVHSTFQVPYLTFQDAITRAKAEDKLVHHILLWGALDDQSC